MIWITTGTTTRIAFVLLTGPMAFACAMICWLYCSNALRLAGSFAHTSSSIECVWHGLACCAKALVDSNEAVSIANPTEKNDFEIAI